MQNVINKTRNLIKDNYDKGYDAYIYESTKIFTLTESNVDSSTIKLYKNGTEVSSSGNWTYNSDTNKINYTASLTVGDLIEIIYSCYKKYSDTEIKGYIKSALYYISIYKSETFTAREDVFFPTPTEIQENLIAIIASILILPSIRSYRTSEITIVFTENESKDDKIKKIISNFYKCIGSIEFHGIGTLED